MLPSELHAVQETRGSKCVSIWEKQSGGLFRSACINPSVNAYSVATFLCKGGYYIFATEGIKTTGGLYHQTILNSIHLAQDFA